MIDFADEDLPDQVETTLRQYTAALITDIATILDDDRAGELIRDGVVVALVGPVNAGKSTILNGLAGRAAAIVSDEAGTTRDIVSVRLDLNGVPTSILDRGSAVALRRPSMPILWFWLLMRHPTIGNRMLIIFLAVWAGLIFWF